MMIPHGARLACHQQLFLSRILLYYGIRSVGPFKRFNLDLPSTSPQDKRDIRIGEPGSRKQEHFPWLQITRRTLGPGNCDALLCDALCAVAIKIDSKLAGSATMSIRTSQTLPSETSFPPYKREMRSYRGVRIVPWLIGEELSP